ncbi:Hypothetical predicted protein [Mytilus galloprovincialis]|uniref:Uncharacterized protein n=1 Tax=Mytilus galloprovincialis TaxID=29158 RepID=A0A8B6DZX1_MYTGA|nr:Hypothetical predicted protein [Mytilus galloprovincialis]
MMQNTQDLDAYSNRLYQYMCVEVVGSEKTVRKTRLLYKLQDDISNKKQCSVISSGSKAEGLNLPGSDFDIMILIKEYEVYEEEQGDREGVLFLDTEHAAPGFTMLKYKRFVANGLMNTFYRAGYGWLLLVAFFYSKQEYKNMRPILEFSFDLLCLYTDCTQNSGSVPPSFKEVSKMKRMISSSSFLMRMKFEIARIHQLDYDNFTAGTFHCVSHYHLSGIKMVGTSQLL